MRDISKYENVYNCEICENIQVIFRRKKVIELMEKYNHRRILEIGCGNHLLFEFFQDFEEMSIVEPGKGFAENARSCKDNYPQKKINIFEDTIENIFKDIKTLNFDYIVISSLLHEIENPMELLSCVFALCSDNTVIHINVPNALSLHRLIAKEMGLIQDVHQISSLGIKLQQNNVFDLDQISQMLKESKFEVLERGTYFPKVFSYAQLEKMIKYEIIDESYFDGMYSLGEYLPDYGSELYIQAKISLMN